VAFCLLGFNILAARCIWRQTRASL